ncbi:MAG: hypothetical protein PGN37_12300 [Mycobacterium kyogaense]|uniref:hypothetical protein n=1 Tax=Mycobacterium kyogaense TaxID=2212479 RepID=UPI002FFB05DB
MFAYEVWERRRSDKRRQAEQITAWLGPGLTSQYREWIQGQGLDTLVHVPVLLINASDSVIYDLVVVVTCQHSEVALPMQLDSGQLVQSTPTAWEPRRDRLAFGRAPALPPGQWKVSIRLANTSVRPHHVDIFFRDNRGTYWRRASLGQLSEQPYLSSEELTQEARREAFVEALGEGPSDARFGILVPKQLKLEEAT